MDNIINRKELTEHPDDLRSDGATLLREFLTRENATTQVLAALNMEPGLGIDIDNGCIHMDEFDLVPFASYRTYGRGLGGPKVMDCIGWIGIGGVHISGGRWEPDSVDEIEEARSDSSLPELVRALLLLRYDRELGHANNLSEGCPNCQGSGCVDPLEDKLKDCPACDGSGLADEARQALEKFLKDVDINPKAA